MYKTMTIKTFNHVYMIKNNNKPHDDTEICRIIGYRILLLQP